ncbi:MAG: LptF/LptG family permease [Phycisphaerae bacterium]|nr:LptF/LptG family permease [Phycisphaerae bacterium]
MKILDKYIIKNFVIGYIIAFCVLIGLRVIIDLFINLDEFAEHSDLGTLVVVKNILTYYGLNVLLYFRDFAGMITVVAAVFSLGKMIHNNELVAIMASGVSLKRVIMPIIIIAVGLTGLHVIDQEIVIPPLSDKLVRDKDAVPGEERYSVFFMNDANSALISTHNFDVKTATMYNPNIILRRAEGDGWRVTGRIDADQAQYNHSTGKWELKNAYLIERGSFEAKKPVKSFATSITPKDIPVMRQSENKTLLSWKMLHNLSRQEMIKKDLAQLSAQMHFHVTEPIINFIMLLISLPVLVCRDPKAMKSAIMTSFTLTGGCMIANFAGRLLATEPIFGTFRPEIWAWLPVFIFLPISVLMLDSMKS